MREASGFRVAVHMVAEWAVETWESVDRSESGPVEFTVHVTPALVAAVIAEAEVLCAMDAARAEFTTEEAS